MNPPLLHPPFDLTAFLTDHGFRQVRRGPDVYRHGRVEVEDNGGHLYVRRYTSLERRLVDWACAYGPGAPPALISMAILAAFTPIPVAPADAGDWSVWAAVPIPVAAELSHDTARAATRWLRARGWPYATFGPDRSAPPTGAPAPRSDTP
ncbi:hypothetical protein [Parafrankia discariae]|uniref:hypothetical protein n=1 Tax=Parafrankia discariae TaxID=365528 RepID=UPI00036BBCA8|nr:hypothetical protein [Parafrankia discariae]